MLSVEVQEGFPTEVSFMLDHKECVVLLTEEAAGKATPGRGNTSGQLREAQKIRIPNKK